MQLIGTIVFLVQKQTTLMLRRAKSLRNEGDRRCFTNQVGGGTREGGGVYLAPFLQIQIFEYFLFFLIDFKNS